MTFYPDFVQEEGGDAQWKINLIERVYGKDAVSKGLKIEKKNFLQTTLLMTLFEYEPATPHERGPSILPLGHPAVKINKLKLCTIDCIFSVDLILFIINPCLMKKLFDYLHNNWTKIAVLLLN